MLETIGFLELNSIAKGVEAADLILKTAEVDLILPKPDARVNTTFFLPGKWQQSKRHWMQNAAIGGNHTVDSCVIRGYIPRSSKPLIWQLNRERRELSALWNFQRDSFCLCGRCGSQSS